MNYKLEIREKANQNITEAGLYYEEQQIGLALDFWIALMNKAT